MSRLRRKVLLIVLAVSVAIMLSMFCKIENWKRDFTVNYAKLENEASDPLLRPPTIAKPIDEVADMIERWADQRPRWTMESRGQTDGEIEVHLTRTTRVMRFADDVHVRLIADENGTRVEAESRSRIGKGDLGQNPRNLRELVSGLREDR